MPIGSRTALPPPPFFAAADEDRAPAREECEADADGKGFQFCGPAGGGSGPSSPTISTADEFDTIASTDAGSWILLGVNAKLLDAGSARFDRGTKGRGI